MWIFSDATSADYEDSVYYSQVFSKIKLKAFQVNYNKVGICIPWFGCTSSQDAMVTETPVSSVDERVVALALETGGQIFLGNLLCSNPDTSQYRCCKSERNQSLIRDDYMPISRARVDLNKHVATVYVPVDNTINSVSFSLYSFDGKINDVQISRPDGTVVVYSNPSVTFGQLGPQTIVAVHNPIVGNWNVSMSGSGQATFIAQGDITINLNYIQFVSSVVGCFEEMFTRIPEGNPYVDGKSSTTLARLDGSVTNYTFDVVNTAGTTIKTAAQKLQKNTISPMDDNVLTIEPLDKPFSVMVTGFTLAGNSFQFLVRSTFVPKEIKVSFNESSCPGALLEEENATVLFTMENF
jgi:hypothetical protein